MLSLVTQHTTGKLLNAAVKPSASQVLRESWLFMNKRLKQIAAVHLNPSDTCWVMDGCELSQLFHFAVWVGS